MTRGRACRGGGHGAGHNGGRPGRDGARHCSVDAVRARTVAGMCPPDDVRPALSVPVRAAGTLAWTAKSAARGSALQLRPLLASPLLPLLHPKGRVLAPALTRAPPPRANLRRALRDTMLYALRHHPHLRYYQGFHDVCAVLVHCAGAAAAPLLAERLCAHRLSAFMGQSMLDVLAILRLLPLLLREVDPPLAAVLEDTGVRAGEGPGSCARACADGFR